MSQRVSYVITSPAHVRAVPMSEGLYAETRELVRLCLLCGQPTQELWVIREAVLRKHLGLFLPKELRRRFTSTRLMYHFGNCTTCVHQTQWVHKALEELDRLLRTTNGVESHGRLALAEYP